MLALIGSLEKAKKFYKGFLASLNTGSGKVINVLTSDKYWTFIH